MRGILQCGRIVKIGRYICSASRDILCRILSKRAPEQSYRYHVKYLKVEQVAVGQPAKAAGRLQDTSIQDVSLEPVGYKVPFVTQVLGGVFLLLGETVGASDRTLCRILHCKY